jgi:hypothetical protein
MPIELQEGQKLKRVIRVNGIVPPVIASITRDGITFKVAESKVGVSQTWTKLVAACNTPPNVPQFLAGQPIKYLQRVSSQIVKNKIKKEEARAS